MERDFMGLNSKDTVVEEEAPDGSKEPGGFEAFNNHQAGEIQSVHSMRLHQETKQVTPINTTSSFFWPHFAGAPVTSPHSVHASTGPWYGPKVGSAPAQLTIFYGGMVNVYDDITPEKAQAIMFLAGNGVFVAASTPHPRGQAQVITSMSPAGDTVYASQPINTQPCSVGSSPMSVSVHPSGQSANQDEATKTMACSTKMDTPGVVSSLGQVMQSAIPQARKASLARFLQKRKERVMASVPYSLSKNSGDTAASMDAIVVASERRE